MRLRVMLRMLTVGNFHGIRFGRKLCEDVALQLVYRWLCRLNVDDKIPNHSTFSVNHHGRFRESDISLPTLSRWGSTRAWGAALVKGEGC